MTDYTQTNNESFSKIKWPTSMFWKKITLLDRGDISKLKTCRRGFWANGSRYHFDLNLSTPWQQWSTRHDAWYHGIWVNPTMYEIVTYAEGDITYEKFATREDLGAQLKHMTEVYGSPPPDFIGIDTETGQTTEYYSDRLEN